MFGVNIWVVERENSVDEMMCKGNWSEGENIADGH